MRVRLVVHHLRSWLICVSLLLTPTVLLQTCSLPVLVRFDEANQRWYSVISSWGDESQTASTAIIAMSFYTLLAEAKDGEMLHLFLPAIRN